MDRAKSLSLIWVFCLILASVLIVTLMESNSIHVGVPVWAIVVLLFLISAFCEYIDSSLGMGYGTTLTPLLLTFGVVRAEIVPVILLSELMTGFFAGIAHHREGNVNLKKDKNIKTAVIFLTIPSIIGVVTATVLSSRLKEIGQHYANLYIGLMIVAIGIYLIYSNLVRKRIPGTGTISKPRLLILGIVAAFNKGVSGGGYGPLMTGGQLTAGVKEKEAVVITSLCEGFTCFTGLVAFFILGGSLNWFYVVPLCMGSMVSVVPAAKTIRVIPEGLLKKAIGWATLLLGLMTLWKFLH
ncbi:MAG: sulfite exporter TauE/SafE family protein [Bacteroidales bacterium]|nr:sulfite exporter TauE/SafE family protein [Bacteroidales bacterium]MDD3907590.1 sulfite exporter TauE/SafE family protein [Bacteroidales bacterium]MDD4713419.1 sulfite exporter TauE/SafE family protein [Bacteroidales bacterium]